MAEATAHTKPTGLKCDRTNFNADDLKEELVIRGIPRPVSDDTIFMAGMMSVYEANLFLGRKETPGIVLQAVLWWALNKDDIIKHAMVMGANIEGERADIIEAMLLTMKAKIEEKNGDKGKLSWIVAVSGFFWRRFSCIEELKSVEAISDGWIMTEKENLPTQSSVELKAEASETACEIEDEGIKAIQFELALAQHVGISVEKFEENQLLLEESGIESASASEDSFSTFSRSTSKASFTSARAF